MARLLPLLLALPLWVQAQSPCADGGAIHNPLTQPAALMPGGIGGTGAVAFRPGMGGTGIRDEGGIGGTGIVGVITGFASVCVNGAEVHVDAGTEVMDGASSVPATRLAVGQWVVVRAAGADANLRARSIALLPAAIGPLGEVDPAQSRLRLLGQTVRVADPAALSGLRAGEWVRVSGARDAQGDIVASLVERVGPQGQVMLTGRLERSAGDRLHVGPTELRFPGQALPQGLRPGQELQVSGDWDGSSLVVQTAAAQPTLAMLGPVERVSIQGYLKSIDNRSLDIGSATFGLAAAAQVVGLDAGGLVAGRFVQLQGRMGSDRQVVIDRIEVREGPGGSGAARSAAAARARTEAQRPARPGAEEEPARRGTTGPGGGPGPGGNSGPGGQGGSGSGEGERSGGDRSGGGGEGGSGGSGGSGGGKGK